MSQITRQAALEMIADLQAKPSRSEDKGVALLTDADLHILSVGISTGGIAEMRMAKANPQRKIIATTIDTAGLEYVHEMVAAAGLESQIETKYEDLREPTAYPDASFDFIYARLVIHYLNEQDLIKALAEFHRILKTGGRLFVVVPSVKNIPERPDVSFDPQTHLTSIPSYTADGTLRDVHTRFYQTPETISRYLEAAGFAITEVSEYDEQLFGDFMRQKSVNRLDNLIEVVAEKR